MYLNYRQILSLDECFWGQKDAFKRWCSQICLKRCFQSKKGGSKAEKHSVLEALNYNLEWGSSFSPSRGFRSTRHYEEKTYETIKDQYNGEVFKTS